MRRAGVVSLLLALVAAGVVAGWVWSAEEEAAAPAEGAEAEAAPAEGEEEAVETAKGYTCEVKAGIGRVRRPRAFPATVKLTETKMRWDDKNVKGQYRLADAQGRASYTVNVVQDWDELHGVTGTRYRVEKFGWSDIQRLRKMLIDGAVQNARMLMRSQREQAEKEIADLQALTKPATMEAAGETKEIAGLTCTKYTISQGDSVKGSAWITKDIKLDVPLAQMVAHCFNETFGGIPAVADLDELEGVPAAITLEFPMIGRRRQVRVFTFEIAEITEADVNVAELALPRGDVEVEDFLRSRVSRRGEPSGPPPGMGIR